jgi:hypothetical protein
MLENIQQANGNLDKTNIRCLPCGKLQSGGFDANYGILLCQNRLIDRSHMEDTLAHELVHAYDHLRFDVDWKDLRHHACSEVSFPRKRPTSLLTRRRYALPALAANVVGPGKPSAEASGILLDITRTVFVDGQLYLSAIIRSAKMTLTPLRL